MSEKAEELINSLEFRYRGCPPEATIEIGQGDNVRMGYPRTYRNNMTSYEKIAREFAGREEELHVYSRTSVLHPNHPQDKRGTEEDNWGTTLIHVDLDPTEIDIELHGSVENWQDWRVESLKRFDPIPSRIEFSGRGFYGFWKLEEFTTDWKRVKRINKWLTLQLGGDHCFDTARLLRLPGTFNGKEGVCKWSRRIA